MGFIEVLTLYKSSGEFMQLLIEFLELRSSKYADLENVMGLQRKTRLAPSGHGGVKLSLRHKQF